MRIVIVVVALLALTAGATFAQTASPGSQGVATVTVSPAVSGIGAPRDIQIRGLAPGGQVLVVVSGPSGAQLSSSTVADSSGTANMHVTPPGGRWSDGLYRVIASNGDGRSVSATFVASDGNPRIDEQEALPSPFSAFHFVGTGLPASTQFDLVLILTGGLGTRSIHVVTSADGTFSAFLWPQQLGFPFWSAGPYRLTLPELKLEAAFTVREHPVSAAIIVDGPVLPGSTAAVHFSGYDAGRFLWVVYADLAGRTFGEALVGPTDRSGRLNANVHFPDMPGGRYLIATPYDWGEASFDVPVPTSTPTPTVTATPTPPMTATPTVTPTATSAPTRTPASKSCKKHAHRVHGLCACKKGYTRVKGKCTRIKRRTLYTMLRRSMT